MNIQTILISVVGIVIVVGAVLHTILFPELSIPTWLVTAVSTVIGYLFGIKRDGVAGAFRLKKKEAKTEK